MLFARDWLEEVYSTAVAAVIRWHVGRCLDVCTNKVKGFLFSPLQPKPHLKIRWSIIIILSPSECKYRADFYPDLDVGNVSIRFLRGNWGKPRWVYFYTNFTFKLETHQKKLMKVMMPSVIIAFYDLLLTRILFCDHIFTWRAYTNLDILISWYALRIFVCIYYVKVSFDNEKQYFWFHFSSRI